MSQIVHAMSHPPSQDLYTGEWDDSRTLCGRKPGEVQAFSVTARWVNCSDCVASNEFEDGESQ